MTRRLRLAAVLVAVLVASGCASGSPAVAPTATPTPVTRTWPTGTLGPTSFPTASARPTVTAASAPTAFSDGVYEVGVDIQPGKYKSRGGSGCYWARLADDQEDIIDNSLTDGPSTVTVKPSDGYLELGRCTWTKVS